MPKTTKNKNGNGRFRTVQVGIRMSQTDKNRLDYIAKHRKMTKTEVIVRAINDIYDELVNSRFR